MSKYTTKVYITDGKIKSEKLSEFTEKFGFDEEFEEEIEVNFSFTPGSKGRRAHKFDQPDPDDPAEVEIESYTIDGVCIEEYLKDDFKVNDELLFEVAIEEEQSQREEASERKAEAARGE